MNSPIRADEIISMLTSLEAALKVAFSSRQHGAADRMHTWSCRVLPGREASTQCAAETAFLQEQLLHKGLDVSSLELC